MNMLNDADKLMMFMIYITLLNYLIRQEASLVESYAF
jgi:hypothetical protein